MQIQKIKLINYRNYPDKEIFFESGLNVLLAPNGTGKSNILEAIYLLSTTKSFRTNITKNLILYNKNEAFVNANLLKNNQELFVSTKLIQHGKKKFLINKNPVTRINDIFEMINMVCFTPEDIEIVKGAPSERRKYLDLLLNKLDPKYFEQLHKYTRLLKQKHKLLKDHRTLDKNLLEVINQQLSEPLYYMGKRRKQLIERINQKIKDIILKVTDGKEVVEIKYLPSLEERDAREIENKLNSSFNYEKMYGHSQYGVHKDDFDLILNNKDAKSFASFGQQRLITLALRIFEIEIIQEKYQQMPIILLDDVLLELDNPRKRLILNVLQKEAQIILTATDFEKINEIEKNKHIIQLDSPHPSRDASHLPHLHGEG